MEISFSRHSKRRMKLYDIPEKVVQEIVEKEFDQEKYKQVIIKQVKGFRYPLKIIIKRENDTILIITAYLLKRGLS